MVSEAGRPQGFRETRRHPAFCDGLMSIWRITDTARWGESDIMSPRIADQPDSVFDVVADPKLREGKAVPPGDVMTQQAQRRRSGACGDLPAVRLAASPRGGFRWWYRRLQPFCALREANRHHLLYYSTAVRHLLLQLGERMVEQGNSDSSLTTCFISPWMSGWH